MEVKKQGIITIEIREKDIIKAIIEEIEPVIRKEVSNFTSNAVNNVKGEIKKEITREIFHQNTINGFLDVAFSQFGKSVKNKNLYDKKKFKKIGSRMYKIEKELESLR